MSGPKGMSYRVVETPAQRARRELAEARSRLASARGELAVAAAGLEALGVHFRSAVADGQGHDAASVQAMIDAIQAEISEISRQTGAAASRRAEDFAAEAMNRLHVAAMGGDMVDLRGPVKRTSTGRQTPDTHTRRTGADDPAIVTRVERSLKLLGHPDEKAEALAARSLSSPPDTAALLAAALSDRAYAADDARRRQEQEHRQRRQAEAEEAAAKAVAASDDEYVLAQVADCLGELGYSVSGTSLTRPGQIVVADETQRGFGIAAGLDPDAGEVVLRPIQIDGTPPAVAAQHVEEALCDRVPGLVERLAAGGIAVSRVRSMPAGIIPVPVERAELEAAPARAARRSTSVAGAGEKAAISQRRARGATP